VICLVEALCRATHRAWSPAHAAEASRLGLERALEMSPEENAAHLVHGPAKQFALLGGGLPPESETVSSARSWLRGLRDSAYATVALLAVHAPGAFYPSDAVAAAVSRAAHFDIKSARDRHARALVHTVARPVLSRCPASHRARWHAALTTGLVPHMHERLSSAWARSRREASAAENVFGGVEDGEAAAFAASLGAGGGAAAVAELVSDRVTRDLTRDHCALLELLAAPEGTFGRKTKGSGLTGHLQNLQGGLTGAPTAAGETAAAERLAHGGGKHVLEWMAATRAAEGGVAGDRCARAALATAAAAVTWGDSEAAGKALGFLRGIVAAAAASGPGAAMSALGGGAGFGDGVNKNAPPPAADGVVAARGRRRDSFERLFGGFDRAHELGAPGGCARGDSRRRAAFAADDARRAGHAPVSSRHDAWGVGPAFKRLVCDSQREKGGDAGEGDARRGGGGRGRAARVRGGQSELEQHGRDSDAERHHQDARGGEQHVVGRGRQRDWPKPSHRQRANDAVVLSASYPSL
jgi:hypothetical protein